MTATASNYTATFILDTRGREESIEDLIEGLKGEIAAAGADVTGVEDLGRREFERTPDIKYTSGVFVRYEFAASSDVPAAILEALKLNKLVSHKMIQKA